jgi:hypothetical protein
MGWHAAITLCCSICCFLVGGIGADAWEVGIAVLVLEAGGCGASLIDVWQETFGLEKSFQIRRWLAMNLYK